MRVINLCHGAGNGVNKACLMTSSNMLIGRSQDLDDNHCVCPIIRQFVIPTNDIIPLDYLKEFYGPLVWEILGTRTDNIFIIARRVSLIKNLVNKWSLSFDKEFFLRKEYCIKQLNFKHPSCNKIIINYYCEIANFLSYCISTELDNLIKNSPHPINAHVKACSDLIREMCKVGDLIPIERTITMDELAEKLQPC